MDHKSLTIVCPVYNEEANIFPFVTELDEFFASISCKFTILFSDNSSEDKTLSIIKALAAEDSRIKYVSYAKNYGYERSIYTALTLTESDCVVVIDVDLEDPPVIIKDFLKEYCNGYDFVYGIRKSRKESYALTTVRRLFYYLNSRLLGNPKSRNVGNFYLVSKRVVSILRQINDPEPYIRGTLFSLNIKSIGVEYNRSTRMRGESKFGILKLFDFAFLSIINSIKRPVILSLRASFFIGLSIFCFMIFYLSSRVFYTSIWPAGIATIVILVLFTMLLTALFFGIFGFYIIKIYKIIENPQVTVVLDSNIKKAN